MNPLFCCRPATVVAVLALTFAGCSKTAKTDPDRFVVRGRLVQNGEPFQLDSSKIPLPKGAFARPPGEDPSSYLRIQLISVETQQVYPAQTNPVVGTFEVAGNDGKGIKAGRYKIAIEAKLGFSPGDPDYFNNRFSPEKTKILRDIRPGEDVVIDISKAEG